MAAAASASASSAAAPAELPESLARLDGLASVLAELSERFDFPAAEHEVLGLWKAVDAFQKQVEYSKDRPEFTFYDGPPFATGEEVRAAPIAELDMRGPRRRGVCAPRPAHRPTA